MTKDYTIDFDEPEAQEMLVGLYTSLREHHEFWARWLTDRLGEASDFWAPDEKEKLAASALGESLKAIADWAKDHDSA